MNPLKLIKKSYKVLTDSNYRFYVLSGLNFYRKMPDEEYLKRLFLATMGKELNLNEPQTYNEKLQWLKLYDRKPKYTTMVDKYDVKQYVAKIIGEEYVIPTLGVWDRFEDIDFDALPNQFVLKCTHDSGGLVICRDKANFDWKKARRKIEDSLKRNYYLSGREWPYKNVKPRILAEKYMEDSITGELRDYKFFCFGGKVELLFVATDRQKEGEEVKFDFFDPNYVHQPIRQGHQNATVLPEKPQAFEKMKEFATLLSKDIPQVRVDFYEVEGKIYFGEITFFHFGGFVPFDPPEWDEIIGSWIILPPKHEEIRNRNKGRKSSV